VAVLVADALNDKKKAVNGSRILVSGVAYKRDIADMRESPALDVITELEKRGAEVSYHDPYVAELDHHGADTHPHLIGRKSVPDPVRYEGWDAVVIVTDHTNVDYGRMAKEASLVVDTRNALVKAGIKPEASKFARL